MTNLIKNFKNIFESSKADSKIVMKIIHEIKIHEEISRLFSINQEVLNKISDSMKEKGYDSAEPVVIGRIENVGEFLVDGHTRLQAAKNVGLLEIPVVYMDFKNFEEAIFYTFKRQSSRRNLTAAELLNAAGHLQKKTIRDGTGRSSKILAESLGVSESTIDHAKFIKQNANKEIIEEIENGNLSINAAYTKIKNDEKKQRNATDDQKISSSNQPAQEKTIIKKKEVKEKIIPSIKTEKEEPKLVNLLQIIKILIKNNEKTAAKLLLTSFKSLIPENFLTELKIEKTKTN